jgi:hydrogenase maturation protease
MPPNVMWPLIIGIGNPDRGDDAAGRHVAQLLRPLLPDDVAIAEQNGEATSLVSEMGRAEAVFLIDACASGGSAGTVYRFDAVASPLPAGTFRLSTHGFSLAEAIELARVLDQLPPHCIVYAIEGECFATGAPLSPSVRTGIDDVVRRLLSEINLLRHRTHA